MQAKKREMEEERAWMVLSRRAMHSVRPPPLAVVRLGSRSPEITLTVSGLPAMCLHHHNLSHDTLR